MSESPTAWLGQEIETLMVRIRLTRIGAKKKPFYRLIATDQRSPRDGRFIEQLGWYDPLKNPHQVKFNLDRVAYWLSMGAQPTETAGKLIAKAKTEAEAAATAEAN